MKNALQVSPDYQTPSSTQDHAKVVEIFALSFGFNKPSLGVTQYDFRPCL